MPYSRKLWNNSASRGRASSCEAEWKRRQSAKKGAESKGFDSTGGEIGRGRCPRPNKLGMGWAGLAVLLDMCLGCFRSVVHCVFVVTAG